MAISAISFEQEDKCIEALAKELAKNKDWIWDNLERWKQEEFKREARPFFNAMYDILRGYDNVS